MQPYDKTQQLRADARLIGGLAAVTVVPAIAAKAVTGSTWWGLAAGSAFPLWLTGFLTWRVWRGHRLLKAGRKP
ncbi:hypothetical protein [Bailinhaonella thermotolerans]|nr:hypothetical protein [Bailinhaonella thermotolerans]